MDKIAKALFIIMIVDGSLVGILGIPMLLNTQNYSGCTVTGQTTTWSNYHAYDVSCSGTPISNVAGGEHYSCARVGDIVKVSVATGWFGDLTTMKTITGDNSC